jgi:hypothetical protein
MIYCIYVAKIIHQFLYRYMAVKNRNNYKANIAIYIYNLYHINYISALNEINLKRGVGLERLYFNGFNTLMRTRFDAFDVLNPNF